MVIDSHNEMERNAILMVRLRIRMNSEARV